MALHNFAEIERRLAARHSVERPMRLTEIDWDAHWDARAAHRGNQAEANLDLGRRIAAANAAADTSAFDAADRVAYLLTGVAVGAVLTVFLYQLSEALK